MEKILEDRENRSKLIKSYLEKSNNNIIVIKANVVGKNKSPYFAYLVVRKFFGLVKSKLNVLSYHFFESFDGPYFLIETDVDLIKGKEILIKLEDEEKLGRLVDLDIYGKLQSLSRNDLGYPLRKCLVCDCFAHFCTRSQKHSLVEIENKVDALIKSYLRDVIKKFIDDAITFEANLDPKFGLVTINSSGSHPDMDYSLLMKAKEVIVPDLVEMFFYGFLNDLDDAFKKARELGITTEKKMFKATNNINVYKGLIFILGNVLVALGYAIKNNRSDLSNIIKEIGKDLMKEFDDNIDSFGKKAYKEFKISGARGEVSQGLKSVFAAKKLITSFNPETLTKTLIYLIKNIDDTVLLKRAKTLDRYYYFKNLVGNIESYDLDLIKKITDECIENNISFGGSADLLIASIFLKLIERELVMEYE